jgi:hypothetical protein
VRVGSRAVERHHQQARAAARVDVRQQSVHLGGVDVDAGDGVRPHRQDREGHPGRRRTGRHRVVEIGRGQPGLPA